MLDSFAAGAAEVAEMREERAAENAKDDVLVAVLLEDDDFARGAPYRWPSLLLSGGIAGVTVMLLSGGDDE